MLRCSGLKELLKLGRPSKLANGLKTGFGCCRCGACPTVPRAVGAGGAIDPVACCLRGGGIVTFCAFARTANRHTNKAVIAAVAYRAMNCPVIQSPLRSPLL